MMDLDAPWIDLPWVAIDFETTGPSPRDAEPVEVAAVRFEQGKVVDSYTTLIKPNAPIPAAATAIHGITDDMVHCYWPLPAYAAELARLCRDALPVAYNEAFDRVILHRYIAGIEAPAFHLPQWVCPMVIVKDRERITPGKGWYKLENVCKRWGVELSTAHRAGGDATAAGSLLWRLYDKGEVKPCSARRLLAHVEKRAAEHEAARTW